MIRAIALLVILAAVASADGPVHFSVNFDAFLERLAKETGVDQKAPQHRGLTGLYIWNDIMSMLTGRPSTGVSGVGGFGGAGNIGGGSLLGSAGGLVGSGFGLGGQLLGSLVSAFSSVLGTSLQILG